MRFGLLISMLFQMFLYQNGTSSFWFGFFRLLKAWRRLTKVVRASFGIWPLN